jgi:hypothetical protein
MVHQNHAKEQSVQRTNPLGRPDKASSFRVILGMFTRILSTEGFVSIVYRDINAYQEYFRVLRVYSTNMTRLERFVSLVSSSLSRWTRSCRVKMEEVQAEAWISQFQGVKTSLC